jgi:hypothetical protein
MGRGAVGAGRLATRGKVVCLDGCLSLGPVASSALKAGSSSSSLGLLFLRWAGGLARPSLQQKCRHLILLPGYSLVSDDQRRHLVLTATMIARVVPVRELDRGTRWSWRIEDEVGSRGREASCIDGRVGTGRQQSTRNGRTDLDSLLRRRRGSRRFVVRDLLFLDRSLSKPCVLLVSSSPSRENWSVPGRGY